MAGDQSAGEKGLTSKDLGVNSSFTPKDAQKVEQKDAKGIYDFALKLEQGQTGMTQAEKRELRKAVDMNIADWEAKTPDAAAAYAEKLMQAQRAMTLKEKKGLIDEVVQRVPRADRKALKARLTAFATAPGK